jgi:hypothetical protein
MAFSGFYPYDEPIDLSPSELSHGRDLRPRFLRGASPEEGGYYHGRSPSMNPGRKWRTGYPGERLQS